MSLDVKLMTVLRKLNGVLLDNLERDLKTYGTTASEYKVLVHLNEVDKETIQQLAKVALITSGTATHLIKKMLKNDYVTREQDLSDKRIFWVSITPKGRNYLNLINCTHLKYLETLLKNFTDKEKEDFIDQIKYFGKNLPVLE